MQEAVKRCLTASFVRDGDELPKVQLERPGRQ
jgi:hypothetical protein